MKRGLLPLALLAAAFAVQATVATAQTDLTVPGGANGQNVFCLQAGDINSGAFVGTYLQTATGAWEERLKAGSFKLAEKKRDDLTVELADDKRGAAVQFDFVNRTVKYKPSSPANASWRDRYYILNATDKAGATDCAALAALAALSEPAGGGPGAGGPGAGGGGGGGANRGGGGGGGARPPITTPVIIVVVPPKTPLNIPSGTQLTALSGPACPGHPDMFLCPNKFSCAPIGGVCCPGANACKRGEFCDHFVAGACIGPGNRRFCPGTANMAAGEGAHCDVGLTCGPNGCL